MEAKNFPRTPKKAFFLFLRAPKQGKVSVITDQFSGVFRRGVSV